jgi:hypothetical protein
MNPDIESQNRFERWKNHVLKIGFADNVILLYLWALYDTLLEEIQELKKTIQNLKNGKA